MDSSPTFQFVVDALRRDWQVIAPDWRGFGGSTWLGHSYWFPDYYADLEVLLAHYAPEGPVRLVGHSMGAAVAGVYAGLRPERVGRLAMLDFLGLKPPPEADSPFQLRKWLDAQAAAPRLPTHADHAAFARRLRTVNPRLNAARARLPRPPRRPRGRGWPGGDGLRPLAQGVLALRVSHRGRDGVLAAGARAHADAVRRARLRE